MARANTGTAYLLWMPCLFGICGLHRFYAGQIGWGIVVDVTNDPESGAVRYVFDV